MARQISAVLGNSQRLDGGAMFGNAPKALWERWIAPDERNRIPLACRAMLVEEQRAEGTRRVLVEAGIGAFFPPALRDRYGVQESSHVLLESLAALGLGPDDIDVIVLSHLHFDHAGGLLAAYEEGADRRLVFERARFVVGADAFERAKAPHARDRASFIPDLPGLLEATGRLELIRGETSDTLGEGWRFHFGEGHTPGLMLAKIEDTHGPIVFAGDLIPGRAWMHLPITMGYDRYPERLIEEKEALLEDLLARGGRVFFTHDAEVAMATVTKDERGRFGPGAEVSSPIRVAL